MMVTGRILLPVTSCPLWGWVQRSLGAGIQASHTAQEQSPRPLPPPSLPVLGKHLWCAPSLGPGVSFSDLPSEVADGRKRAKTCQEHWKRAQCISRVSLGASSIPEDLFPNLKITNCLAHSGPWDRGGWLPCLSQTPPAFALHPHSCPQPG